MPEQSGRCALQPCYVHVAGKRGLWPDPSFTHNESRISSVTLVLHPLSLPKKLPEQGCGRTTIALFWARRPANSFGTNQVTGRKSPHTSVASLASSHTRLAVYSTHLDQGCHQNSLCRLKTQSAAARLGVDLGSTWGPHGVADNTNRQARPLMRMTRAPSAPAAETIHCRCAPAHAPCQAARAWGRRPWRAHRCHSRLPARPLRGRT